MEPLREELPLTTKEMAAAAQRPVMVERTPRTGPTAAAADEKMTLFPGDQAQDFRSRWETIQAGFVDEPRQAVEQADSLVAETIKRLAEIFA